MHMEQHRTFRRRRRQLVFAQQQTSAHRKREELGLSASAARVILQGRRLQKFVFKWDLFSSEEYVDSISTFERTKKGQFLEKNLKSVVLCCVPEWERIDPSRNLTQKFDTSHDRLSTCRF